MRIATKRRKTKKEGEEAPAKVSRIAKPPKKKKERVSGKSARLRRHKVATTSMSLPYDIVKRASEKTDSVLVALSGGKDSVVTMDLCCKYFKHVEAFFMYVVPNLSFQENYLSFAESHWGVKVHRIPHVHLIHLIQLGTYRNHNELSRAVSRVSGKWKLADVWRIAQEQSGIEWIALGDRKDDSTLRRMRINLVNGVDEKYKRCYPIGDWSSKAIYHYIKQNNLPLSGEYRMLNGVNFGDLTYEALHPVREKYPEDWAKILEYFPYAEAEMMRHEFAEKRREGGTN